MAAAETQAILRAFPGTEIVSGPPEDDEAFLRGQGVLPARSDDPSSPLDLQAFLEEPEEEFDWLIPGVLERSDRLILTGREGAGKSYLLQQLCVQVAAGIHPFGADDFPPLRVLLIDLENSPRELRRRMRPLKVTAGHRLERQRLFISSRRDGLNLLASEEDCFWLEEQIELTQPDLLVTGPIYKLSDGDPQSEKDSKPVAMFLDRMILRYGCAVILEAHLTHEDKAGRPYGWSGWRRWPEIGLELKSTGSLTAWRPARHETPAIPQALQRGGSWPFTVMETNRALVWTRIVDHCAGLPLKPSENELARALNIHKSSIHRALNDHKTEWLEMFE